ncbi:MAG: hypothetical protein RLZZ165_2174 [Bacteroidota bacterium]|jgi:putative chitinase
MDTLKLGSKGEDVRKLQEGLGITQSGDFDRRTELILTAWQRVNKIDPANGVADVSTFQKLGLATAAAPATKTTTPVSPSATPAAQPAPVAKGSASASSGPSKEAIAAAASKLNLAALAGAVPQNVLDMIPEAAATFNISSNLRLAHFLAQCAHESGGFKIVEENLYYSSSGLKKIFPKYFPGNLADSYARQPAKIANRVYGGRGGNGDEASGDGDKYHGRGYIQLTFKDNYTAFAKYIGVDVVAQPELVATKYPLASAAFFFNSIAKIWPVCDKGADASTVLAVTKKVNGGTHGLEDRQARFDKFWKLLSK